MFRGKSSPSSKQTNKRPTPSSSGKLSSSGSFPNDDDFLALARLWPRLKPASKGAILTLARRNARYSPSPAE